MCVLFYIVDACAALVFRFLPFFRLDDLLESQLRKQINKHGLLTAVFYGHVICGVTQYCWPCTQFRICAS